MGYPYIADILLTYYTTQHDHMLHQSSHPPSSAHHRVEGGNHSYYLGTSYYTQTHTHTDTNMHTHTRTDSDVYVHAYM